MTSLVSAAAQAAAQAAAEKAEEVPKISKILQIFGGLVLGCIKTKFCKKICV